jgi:signal transduction histidine kinase
MASGADPDSLRRVLVVDVVEGRSSGADDDVTKPFQLGERVCDRSFRGATAGTRGRGLGLAIVKTIVEDHGGSVTITSAEGQA